jgi:uncharacterized OsmC-like protein
MPARGRLLASPPGESGDCWQAPGDPRATEQVGRLLRRAVESVQHQSSANSGAKTMPAVIKNGVDVDQLMEAIEAVKQDPANGKLRFSVHSKWLGGFRARHTTADYVVGAQKGKHASDHVVETDEPREILGSDRGISPAETLLSALASCLAVGYAANAAALGIDLDELSFEISGQGSLEGFMNLGDARPGLSGIRIEARIRSSAPPDKLQELHEYVNSHSPIWDTICNPVAIESRVVLD